MSKYFPSVSTESVCNSLWSLALPKPNVFILTPFSSQDVCAVVTISEARSVEMLSPSAKTNDKGLYVSDHFLINSVLAVSEYLISVEVPSQSCLK